MSQFTFPGNATTVVMLAAASCANTAAATGTGVDLKDYEGPVLIVQNHGTSTGTLDGKPWSLAQAPAPQPVLIKGYLRMEGIVDVPTQAMVKNVTARILQGTSVRSVQTFQL